MTKTTENIILWAAGLAIVIALILLLIDKCNEAKPDVIAVRDSTQYYKDKLGHEVAAIKQREQDYYREQEKGYLDSIAKLHNSRAKLIQEITSLRQHGTIEVPVAGPVRIEHDTAWRNSDCEKIVAVSQYFANPYYQADVRISLQDFDSSRLHLETFDTLSIVAKTVKEGSIFKRRTYLQIDAVNENPYNHISGLQVYRKPLPKPKKFGIGLFAGYGFGGASFKPSVIVGVGASYSIIRF